MTADREAHEPASDVQRLERELAEARRAVDEMTRFRDLLVGVMGHDLRGALQSLELGSQVLLGKPDDPPAVLRMAATMQRASRRMTRLLEQLLDFARTRLGGTMPMLAAECDVAELARSVIDELEPAARARVALEVTTDPEVRWDRDRMASMLRTVLTNAVQHGTAGTPITVTIDGDAARVRIAVRNDGAVPPELLPILFDPFARAALRRHGAGSVGLGLHILTRIVDAQSGCVRVESSAETGTRFEIDLPRVVAG